MVAGRPRSDRAQDGRATDTGVPVRNFARPPSPPPGSFANGRGWGNQGGLDAAGGRPFRGFHQRASRPVVRVPADVHTGRAVSVALPRVQGRAVGGGAASPIAGLRTRGAGGQIRVDVLAPGAAAAGVQPEDRLPGAGDGPARAAPPLVAQLSEPRQGLRRPDAAAEDLCRDDAAVAEGAGPVSYTHLR